ncbi:uncharacterized protein LOC119727910 [Patiria miniata]|uniref:Integrase zinc-binding domain-containing protein n=1 Tax=Patiria miniata TaxID=46514 RepID=A0A913ZXA0_PATMI|nr:uncharacterized protein LOC119727910 [Patiria miniata]
MMAEPAVLTPLQMCGFDPAPESSKLIDLESLPSAETQPSMLAILQHQTYMQEVILQQFRQIDMLKSIVSRVVGEQQQQRQYIRSLEVALFESMAQRPRVFPIPTPKPDLKTTEVPPRENVHTDGDESGGCSDKAQSCSDEGTSGPQPNLLQALQAQQSDAAIKRVVELKEASPTRMSNRKMEKESRVVRNLLHAWDRLEVKGGLLVFRKGGDKPRFLVVLPRQLRRAAFRSLHRTMETSSYGRVLKVVRERYFWPSLHNETMGYMRQHRKGTRQLEVFNVPPPHEFRDVGRGP